MVFSAFTQMCIYSNVFLIETTEAVVQFSRQSHLVCKSIDTSTNRDWSPRERVWAWRQLRRWVRYTYIGWPSTDAHSGDETLWPPPFSWPTLRKAVFGWFIPECMSLCTTPNPTSVHAPSPASCPPHNVSSNVFAYVPEEKTSTLLAYSIQEWKT